MHRHEHDYVYVVLGNAHITNEVSGKPVNDLHLADGEVRFVAGGFSHVVRDQAESAFRNVTVEFMKDEALRKQPAKWDEERGMNILEGGTQDILFVKDGVRVTDIQLQPGGSMPRHDHKGPHLLVPVTDLHLESNITGRGKKLIEVKAGNGLWVPDTFSHTLKNTSSQKARFITLEFP
jgi:quercetin dioxygenase-like cupin family protein